MHKVFNCYYCCCYPLSSGMAVLHTVLVSQRKRLSRVPSCWGIGQDSPCSRSCHCPLVPFCHHPSIQPSSQSMASASSSSSSSNIIKSELPVSFYENERQTDYIMHTRKPSRPVQRVWRYLHIDQVQCSATRPERDIEQQQFSFNVVSDADADVD